MLIFLFGAPSFICMVTLGKISLRNIHPAMTKKLKSE
jgi:hypothetical protein